MTMPYPPTKGNRRRKCLTGEALRAARYINRLPKTHIFPIVGKLHSAIQADNIRFALAAAEFDRLLPRKRGLSMLTAKNKVEEWPYHPNPSRQIYHL
jgi:hypothetical protein